MTEEDLTGGLAGIPLIIAIAAARALFIQCRNTGFGSVIRVLKGMGIGIFEWDTTQEGRMYWQQIKEGQQRNMGADYYAPYVEILIRLNTP